LVSVPGIFRAPTILSLCAFAALAVAVILTGCGGSSDGSADTDGPATVKTKEVSGYGTALVDASERSLYLSTADPPNRSKCTGSCTKTWHPLTVTGTPTAGGDAKASLLTVFVRPDGSRQVAYNGLPLYTYDGSGPAAGAGLTGQGGTWYLVSPKGEPIEQTAGGGY
jgi:predicted lipoprotein with Yx(FWY)xxD motif